jgi:hypothetical protein
LQQPAPRRGHSLGGSGPRSIPALTKREGGSRLHPGG